MEDESKTADGRRRWQQWTEEQGRAARAELAQSGLSLGKLAAFKGISVRRLTYWRTRLAESGSQRFVDVSTARAATEGRIEIVMGDLTGPGTAGEGRCATGTAFHGTAGLAARSAFVEPSGGASCG